MYKNKKASDENSTDAYIPKINYIIQMQVLL